MSGKEVSKVERFVKVYALEHGVTNESVIRAAGMSYATFWNKANGKTKKGFYLFEAASLAEVLGISLDCFYELVRS